jgi:hypothetical protein
MAQAFDKTVFETEFDKAVDVLAGAEKITKETLKVWANKVVEATHATGQTVYMNKLLSVLTPLNKKVCTLFFSHFSGYTFSKEDMLFVSKDKKRYAQALADWLTFSEDPLKNLWTWAELHVEIEQKPYTFGDVKKETSRMWQRAHKAGMTNVEFLSAMLQADSKEKKVVFSLDDIINALGMLDVKVDAEVSDTSVFVRGDVTELVEETATAETSPF